MDAKDFVHDVYIERLEPADNGALRLIVLIPESNFQAQKLALEAFFESATRDLALGVVQKKMREKSDG